MSARTIIEKFGGVRAMSRKLAEVGREIPPTTIQYWKEKNLIPAGRQSDLLSDAAKLDIAIAPSDFFTADKSAA